jgi:hypothetical protein
MRFGSSAFTWMQRRCAMDVFTSPALLELLPTLPEICDEVSWSSQLPSPLPLSELLDSLDVRNESSRSSSSSPSSLNDKDVDEESHEEIEDAEDDTEASSLRWRDWGFMLL